jgi:hypothetical protein
LFPSTWCSCFSKLSSASVHDTFSNAGSR